MVELITIDNNAGKPHPLQLDYVRGPKGAYELKKTKKGIYVRVDMPGAEEVRFSLVDELKAIHFIGFADKFDDEEWLHVKSKRFYDGYIKLDCQEFNQVKYHAEFSRGSSRFLITGAHNAYLAYNAPQKKDSESETAANEEQPHHNPNNFRLEGIFFESRHNDNCRYCNGNKTHFVTTGQCTEEDCDVNPFVRAYEKAGKGIFETNFKKEDDVTENYFLYIRMDMPGCTDYKVWVWKYCVFVHGITDLNTGDSFQLEENNGRRKYKCQITLNCSNYNGVYSKDTDCPLGCSFLENWYVCKLQYGVLRIQVKILGNKGSITIHTNAKRHPLQLDHVRGPKGAYELRKTENGVYIRVDMPGVRDVALRAVEELKEIRFTGFAHKFDDEGWLIVESKRFYDGTIKLDCQEFNQVNYEFEHINGTCRFLITGVHNAYLTYLTKHKYSESETAANKKQPLASTSHQPHHNPNNFKLEGVVSEEWHNADCKCCNGNTRVVLFNGPWTGEDCDINPFVRAYEKAGKSIFETKFKAEGDATGNYFLYIRMDMPGCTDYKVWVKKYSVFVDSDTGLSTDKFQLDENNGQRKYMCMITLNCSNYYDDNSSSSSCVHGCSFLENLSVCNLKDGVLRILVMILVGERFLAYSDPPHDYSAQCSTTSFTPECSNK